MTPSPNPVRIYWRVDAAQVLPEVVPPGPLLLVTTPGATQRGVTPRVVACLGADRVTRHDEARPNPDLADIEAAAARLRGPVFAAVVALGGGSVIDTAKALAYALAAARPGALTTRLNTRQDPGSHLSLPVIAIPTTAGSGSEVTPFATIWDHAAACKRSLDGPDVYPRAALLDPSLTLSLPREQTLYGGLDVLSHAAESLWNRNRTAQSAASAHRALDLAIRALPELLNHPDDQALRAAMQEAATRAGLAISQTRTALAHAISYPLTLHTGCPHGLACGFTLPAIIDWLTAEQQLAPADQRLLGEVARVIRALPVTDALKQYVSPPRMLALMPEMNQPDRLGNFILPVPENRLRDLLVSSQ